MPNTIIRRNSGNKLTTIERGHIQELIVTCLLRHRHRSEIIDQCRLFNLSDRMIDRYILKAREYIANRPLETTERAKRIILAELEEEYRRAEHSRDRIDIIKYRAKILGLDQIDINVKCVSSIADDKLIEVVLDQEPDSEQESHTP